MLCGIKKDKKGLQHLVYDLINEIISTILPYSNRNEMGRHCITEEKRNHLVVSVHRINSDVI